MFNHGNTRGKMPRLAALGRGRAFSTRALGALQAPPALPRALHTPRAHPRVPGALEVTVPKCFEPFALPTLRASQLRGVLGKRWLSPWHPGCSARHRLFPINSMSVALPHFFSASSSPGAAQRLCGQSPSVPLGQKSWKSFWGAAGSLRTGFLLLKLGALVSPWLGRGDWFWGRDRAG